MFDVNIIKSIVIIILLTTIASLGFAVIALIKHKDSGKSLAKALSWRIGLSISAFIVLLIGYHFGLWYPHKLVP
jgi:hypothetical protein